MAGEGQSSSLGALVLPHKESVEPCIEGARLPSSLLQMLMSLFLWVCVRPSGVAWSELI